MDKFQQFQDIYNLTNMAFRKLMDLSDELRGEFKALLVSRGVKDPEDLIIPDDYAQALLLEDQQKKVFEKAEKLSDFISELIELKI